MPLLSSQPASRYSSCHAERPHKRGLSGLSLRLSTICGLQRGSSAGVVPRAGNCAGNRCLAAPADWVGPDSLASAPLLQGCLLSAMLAPLLSTVLVCTQPASQQAHKVMDLADTEIGSSLTRPASLHPASAAHCPLMGDEHTLLVAATCCHQPPLAESSIVSRPCTQIPGTGFLTALNLSVLLSAGTSEWPLVAQRVAASVQAYRCPPASIKKRSAASPRGCTEMTCFVGPVPSL